MESKYVDTIYLKQQLKKILDLIKAEMGVFLSPIQYESVTSVLYTVQVQFVGR